MEFSGAVSQVASRMIGSWQSENDRFLRDVPDYEAEMARYIHLNPVRIQGLGLDKRRRRANKLAVLSPAGE